MKNKKFYFFSLLIAVVCLFSSALLFNGGLFNSTSTNIMAETNQAECVKIFNGNKWDFYDSLENAVDGAYNGATIVITKDIYINDYITINNKNLTIVSNNNAVVKIGSSLLTNFENNIINTQISEANTLSIITVNSATLTLGNSQDTYMSETLTDITFDGCGDKGAIFEFARINKGFLNIYKGTNITNFCICSGTNNKSQLLPASLINVNENSTLNFYEGKIYNNFTWNKIDGSVTGSQDEIYKKPSKNFLFNLNSAETTINIGRNSSSEKAVIQDNNFQFIVYYYKVLTVNSNVYATGNYARSFALAYTAATTKVQGGKFVGNFLQSNGACFVVPNVKANVNDKDVNAEFCDVEIDNIDEENNIAIDIKFSDDYQDGLFGLSSLKIGGNLQINKINLVNKKSASKIEVTKAINKTGAIDITLGEGDKNKFITNYTTLNGSTFFLSFKDGVEVDLSKFYIDLSDYTFKAGTINAKNIYLSKITDKITITYSYNNGSNKTITQTYQDGDVIAYPWLKSTDKIFEGWYVGDEEIVLSEQKTTTQLFDKFNTFSITGKFRDITKYTIELSITGDGYITYNNVDFNIHNVQNILVNEEQDAEFTFRPYSGWEIVKITIDDDYYTKYGKNIEEPQEGWKDVDETFLSYIQNGVEFEDVSENHKLAIEFLEITFDISLNVGQNGSISYNGTNYDINSENKFVKVGETKNAKFTFVANNGYEVSKIIVDEDYYTKYGKNVDTEPSGYNGVMDSNFITFVRDGFTFTNVTENHSIGVEFSLKEYIITVNYNQTNGNVDKVLAQGENAPNKNVDDGTSNVNFAVKTNFGLSVSFNIKANEHYHIVGSLNAISLQAPIVLEGNAFVYDAGNDCYVYTLNNVDDSYTLTISFVVDTFTISGSLDTLKGVVSPNGEQVVNYNESCEYTITSSQGFNISKIVIDDSFEININNLTEANSNAVLTITSDSQAGGKEIITACVLEFNNIEKDHTFKVYFTENKYAIFLSYNIVESVNGTCNINESSNYAQLEKEILSYGEIKYIIASGSNITFNFSVCDGYHIDSLSLNNQFDLRGSDYFIKNGYTINNIYSDYYVVVSFSSNNYIVKVNVSGDGKIVSEYEAFKLEYGDGVYFKVNYGESVSFKLVLAERCKLSEVQIDGEIVEQDGYEFEFTNVIKDIEVTLSINKTPFILTKQGLMILGIIVGIIILIILIVLIGKAIGNRRMNSLMGDSIKQYKNEYKKINKKPEKQQVKDETLSSTNQTASKVEEKPFDVKEFLNNKFNVGNNTNTNNVASKPTASNPTTNTTQKQNSGLDQEWLKNILNKIDKDNK